jgi:hypothetical protein
MTSAAQREQKYRILFKTSGKLRKTCVASLDKTPKFHKLFDVPAEI